MIFTRTTDIIISTVQADDDELILVYHNINFQIQFFSN